MHKLHVIIFSFLISYGNLDANYWQQRVNYSMEIDFDVKKNQFKGVQKIVYFNNSPDTLTKLFYHLYFNAFQSGSMMDQRNLELADADSRVGSRISKLGPSEIGYQRVISLTMNGVPCHFEEVGTILEVVLTQSINPGDKVELDMVFEAQVPLQIRRSGRDNAEGIQYSMSQWYPKLCEYDKDGWHPNPYVGREFYGVWGDFDVKITIDKNFTLGATGLLQNPEDIGSFFASGKGKRKKGKKTWHFKAKNVHDFLWAADKEYTVNQIESFDGTILQFIYQPGDKTNDVWNQLPKIMVAAHKFMNENFGEYPYPIYSFIQGGDGGMEYPMATLITGERNLVSLVGVSVHEWMHSWYQMVLATDEAQYAWMDEGFTSFASTEVMQHLSKIGMLPKRDNMNTTFKKKFQGFAGFVNSGLEEPLTTHADHFDTNAAYGVGSYTKGQLYQRMLEGIVGEECFDRIQHRFFKEWGFKHPTSKDYLRIAERESGMVLDWFQDYMVHMTKHSDYGISTIIGKQITLAKISKMPMPLDVLVTYIDGSKEYFNIPLRIMRNHKTEDGDRFFTYLTAWPWTNPKYSFEVPKFVKSVEIDPEFRFLDLDRSNNFLEAKELKN